MKASDLDASTATVVDFPLRGEWTALNTPAERIPSHGTDFFAQRFALDFIRLDWTTQRPGRGATWRHLLLGVPASSFYCWNQPVRSAFAGRVIAVGDGWPDRKRVHGLWELLRVNVAVFGSYSAGDDFWPLTGNFVVLEGEPGVALYAHLRQGSIGVDPGDEVPSGTRLGAVGNSGNSTMPHLYFQLMDGPDPRTAAGRLCAFRGYERYAQGAWQPVAVGVPGRLERVRPAYSFAE
ncbi:MAG: M23 family metallopeptidase [Gemmatimonadales bacterium]